MICDGATREAAEVKTGYGIANFVCRFAFVGGRGVEWETAEINCEVVGVHGAARQRVLYFLYAYLNALINVKKVFI